MKLHKIGATFLDQHQIYEKGLKGLKNFGNTCYANAVLQVLLHTPIVVELFETHKIPTLIFLKKESLTLQFMILLHEMWKNNNNGVLSPRELLVKFQNLTKTFNVLEQQDSQEFLNFLYRIMYDELTICINRNGKENSTYNILDNIFMGELQYRIVCSNCSYCSLSKQPFMQLSLSLKNYIDNVNQFHTSSSFHYSFSNITNYLSLFLRFVFNLSYFDKTTLYECLEHYFNKENLTGSHQYFCSKCNKYVDAVRFCSISRPPNILVLHLSRFTFSLRQCFKLNNQVFFSFDQLSLSSYMANEYDSDTYGPTNYQLYAILCHSGTINYGHYYVYINLQDKGWYIFNDRKVSKVDDIRKITFDHPYLLFYKRVELEKISIFSKFISHQKSNNNSESNSSSSSSILLSHHWLTKFYYGVYPTCVENDIYMCSHKKMNPVIYNLKDQIFSTISLDQWKMINHQDNNLSMLMSTDECFICLKVYQLLQIEKKKFFQLNDDMHNVFDNYHTINSKNPSNHTNSINDSISHTSSQKFYISTLWYNKWIQYVDFMNGNLSDLRKFWDMPNCFGKIRVSESAWLFLNSIYSDDAVTMVTSTKHLKIE